MRLRSERAPGRPVISEKGTSCLLAHPNPGNTSASVVSTWPKISTSPAFSTTAAPTSSACHSPTTPKASSRSSGAFSSRAERPGWRSRWKPPAWYSLHECLVRHGYEVAVLNPIQTAKQVAKGIRKTQTDKIDARHIAVLLKNGEQRPALIPSELAMTCRQLSRLQQVMVRQQSKIKQLLWSRIHPVWPEYESLFSEPFGRTGRTLLRTAPVPADVLALDRETLHELVRKASRGRYDLSQVDLIRQAAEGSVGIHRGLPAARSGVRALLAQLDVLEPIRKQVENEIETLAGQLPAYLLTLPGASPLSAVSLFGEIDPIEAFASPGQLIAFAGLDPVVSQSGQSGAPRRRISKRGSPYLRRTLWTMARQACHRPGDLRDYFIRRSRDLSYLEAVTAVAIKLCPIVWRIMTDRRDYLPQRPTTTP